MSVSGSSNHGYKTNRVATARSFYATGAGHTTENIVVIVNADTNTWLISETLYNMKNREEDGHLHVDMPNHSGS